MSGVISFACLVQCLTLQKSNHFFLTDTDIIKNVQTVFSLALTEIFLTSDNGDFLRLDKLRDAHSSKTSKA